MVRDRSTRAFDQPGDGMGSPLMTSELDVAELVACGPTSAEIARRLCICRHKVAARLRGAFRKLGVANRAELAARAVADPCGPRAAQRYVFA
jgi:DNA-binding NarL/FixJ family response regulator